MEALGYDSLWASDHVVIPWSIASKYPYNETGDFPLPPSATFLEPLTALALVAGATERIRLGTTVLVLPHRHPVLAAKMLATLDHLAPGRVILGAGVGWMREEIEIFGVDYARRGAWSDEALRIMKTCWREERPSFRGEFVSFAPLGFAPKPRRGAIPIWIGGHTPRALRRVAELGDGRHAAFATAQEPEGGPAAPAAACRMAVVCLPSCRRLLSGLDRTAHPGAGRQGRVPGAPGDVWVDHRQGPNWPPIRGSRGDRGPLRNSPRDPRPSPAPTTSYAGQAEEGASAECG